MKTLRQLILPAIVSLGLRCLLLGLALPVRKTSASGAWTLTGSLNVARQGAIATLLPSGQVLVAEGMTDLSLLASAELYDPSTGTWTQTGPLNVARVLGPATRLLSGKVLVAGGYSTNISVQASAELYDPSTGTWTRTGSLNAIRAAHTATRLLSGKVLVAGGYSNSATLASAELYDPSTGTWTRTGSLNVARDGATATLLLNGKVLIAGGTGANHNNYLASAELYDPSTGTWTQTSSLNVARRNHTATLLLSGQVLVAGGGDADLSCLASAELYDPSTGTWTWTSPLNVAHCGHIASQLASGQVLVAGGRDASAEVFTQTVDNDLRLTNVPPNMTVNATSPQGAVVTYTPPTVVDEDNPLPPVSCTPSSGSTFAIGTTTVTCTVSDSDDTNSPVSASFTVTVNGAATQVSTLITTVNSFHIAKEFQAGLDTRLQTVQDDLSARNTAKACSDLTEFSNYVKALSGKGLTVSQANQLLSGATNIQRVLGC